MSAETMKDLLKWSDDYADGGMASFADSPGGRYLIAEDFRWSLGGGPWHEGATSLDQAKAACEKHESGSRIWAD